MDSIQDSTRVVVKAERHGSILPGNRAEMGRDIFLLGGADLRGGIFGKQVTVEGAPVRVTDAVYAQGAFRVKAGDSVPVEGALVEFGSAISSADSVLIDDSPFRVRFSSSIYSPTVNLNNAIVYGNVFARNHCTLKNTIVLGCVYCRGTLKMENSIVSTFRVGKANLGAGNSLLAPLALSEQPIRISSPIQCLVFYNLAGEEADGDEAGGSVQMLQTDVYSKDLGTVLEVAEGEPSVWHVLSIDQRVLDVATVSKHFESNRDYILRLSLGSRLDPTSSKAFRDSLPARVENRLFDLLKKPAPSVSGQSALDQLFDRPEVLAAVAKHGLASDYAFLVEAKRAKEGQQ